MDFDFTTETITPDSTSILTIGGTGALELPTGTTGQQPGGAIAGSIRWNSSLSILEYFNGTAWLSFIGSVTSVNLTAGTGISVSGGPITTSGNITVNNTGVTSITGTSNQVIASGSTGAVTLSLPQSIGTTSTPTFNQVTITNAPSAATDTVNLSYLQGVIAGLEWKQEAAAATTANLTATYANGTSGVGATLTNSGTQAAFAVDGYSAQVGDRILVKNQTTQTQNGIYVVTTVGTASTNWVLTRTTDANTPAAMNNATLFITNGTTQANTAWTQTTANPTIGTNNIVFVQNSGSGTYTAGTGLTLTGNAFSLTSPVVATLGGTGTTTAPTAGQVLVGTSGGAYVPFSITSGTGISTTTGSGTLQINNTGVTSFSAGTTGLTPNSATTGAVTLAGVLNVANGGTGLSSTPANGALDIGNGTNFTRTTLTQGTGITITNGAGSITIANAGVTSAVAGTGIGVSGATGAVTFSNTGVLSVSLNDTSTTSIYTTTPTSATTGAVAATIALKTQNANLVFAGPTSGGAAQPSFRSLVKADVINGTTGALQLYNENPSSPTAPVASGTNSVAIGTGSSATATDSFAVGIGSKASIFGVRAFANGNFATAGDAQAVRAVYRISTANNAATEMFLDGSGASQRLVLSNNSAWTYTLRVVARRTDATGTLGSWIFTGLIYQDATAASTTLSGASKTTVARVGNITAANDPVVSADTTNGSLKVLVTGVTGNTIRWVVDAELTQVTN